MLDLLAEYGAAREKRAAARLRRPKSQQYAESTPTPSRHAPKRLFLAELEIVGDIAQACKVAGCTAIEVRHWRSADAMFSRDFTLAIVGHIRALKQLVREIADDDTDPRAADAQALLESEAHYRDCDGRLNVRAWRDALKALIDRFGLDLDQWEPKPPIS